MDDDYIESEPFPGPFVRIRGRVSRAGEVTWSPCIRTYKGPRETRREELAQVAAAAVVGPPDSYSVACLDYRDQPLVAGPVSPTFFATDQEWATFVTRLPYNAETQSVVLRLGEKELGRLDVPTDRPFFTLLHPGDDDFIDPTGVLHLHWAGHDSEHPMTFYVRYSHNDRDWARPGVNLHTNDYYLDLREMPGGKRCRVEVIATNGYRTSYASTRHFEVPTKPPELLLEHNDGPVLFAQGVSREQGPLTGDQISWLADDNVIGTGGTLDIRTLPAGTHQITVHVTDSDNHETSATIGAYDTKSGKRIGPTPGL
jgi:hypothetical protein